MLLSACGTTKSDMALHLMSDEKLETFEIDANPWLAAWRAHDGILPNATSTHQYYEDYEVPEYDETVLWGVTGTLDNHGIQTVSGKSACIGKTDDNTTKPVEPTSIITHSGVNCWCKMTSPANGSWVHALTFSSDSICSLYCAYNCTACVKDGVIGNCTREATLGEEVPKVMAPMEVAETDISEWLGDWKAHIGELPDSSMEWDGYKTPWSVTATTGIHGVQTISGESACVKTRELRTNEEYIATKGAAPEAGDNGTNCLCKMTSPFFGSWVFNFWDEYGSDCEHSCAYYCATCVQKGQPNLANPCTRNAILE